MNGNAGHYSNHFPIQEGPNLTFFQQVRRNRIYSLGGWSDWSTWFHIEEFVGREVGGCKLGFIASLVGAWCVGATVGDDCWEEAVRQGIRTVRTWAPAYDVLWLITTLWILPNFPKYSCFLRTSGSASRCDRPTTNTRFLCTTLKYS